MKTQTILTITLISLALIFLAWRGYIALKRYSCCGSCGCDLMTKKERKAFDQRRANLIKQTHSKSHDTTPRCHH